jgi:hypothetical protein
MFVAKIPRGGGVKAFRKKCQGGPPTCISGFIVFLLESVLKIA